MKKIYMILAMLVGMTASVKAQTVDGRNFGIDGFAAYEGVAGNWYHAGGTTGGAGGEVVKASNLSELQAYLQSSKPYIVLVDKDIDTGITAYVDDLSTGHLCDKQDGSEGVATTYGERIMIADNKTLIGISDASGRAPLFSRITFVMQCTHNVIIRNCRFTMVGAPILKSGENKIVAWREGAQKEVGDPDCIGIQADAKSAKTDSGSHIWIDHCEFFNGNAANKDRYDGLVDCKNNVQWITISYNLFHDHDKACLWGKGDSDVFDNCRTISAHHNYFKDIQGSRLPLQRGGNVHYMNNYQVNSQDGWDLRSKSVGYADACYFKDSKAAILPDGGGVVKINEDPVYGVIYDNCARVITGHAGITFKNDQVADVPTVCEKYSGAGKIEIWKSYATEIPAYSKTNMQAALDSPRTIASSGNTYYTYDAQGNRLTKAPDVTAIENVNGNDNVNVNKVQKAVIDGKVVIIKDGKQYSAAGQLME